MPRPSQPSLLSAPGRGVPARAEGPYREAMTRAGRLLAARPHFSAEMERKLTSAGIAADIVERAVARLTELGLLDDPATARAFAAQRARRNVGTGALIEELRARGLDRTVAETAVAEAGLDDLTAATAAASARVRTVARKPLGDQGRLIYGWLLRRGFEEEIAEAATRKVLPPEGWD